MQERQREDAKLGRKVSMYYSSMSVAAICRKCTAFRLHSQTAVAMMRDERSVAESFYIASPSRK